jgi:hypothetical protein
MSTGLARSAVIPRLAIPLTSQKAADPRVMRFGFTIMCGWYAADYDTLKILDRIKMKVQSDSDGTFIKRIF